MSMSEGHESSAVFTFTGSQFTHTHTHSTHTLRPPKAQGDKILCAFIDLCVAYIISHVYDY